MAPNTAMQTSQMSAQGSAQTNQIRQQATTAGLGALERGVAGAFEQYRAGQQHQMQMQEGKLGLASAQLKHDILEREFQLYDREQVTRQNRAATAMAEQQAIAAELGNRQMAMQLQDQERNQAMPAEKDFLRFYHEKEDGSVVKFDPRSKTYKEVGEEERRVYFGAKGRRDEKHRTEMEYKRSYADANRALAEQRRRPPQPRAGGGYKPPAEREQRAAIVSHLNPQVRANLPPDTEAILTDLEATWGDDAQKALGYIIADQLKRAAGAWDILDPADVVDMILRHVGANPESLKTYADKARVGGKLSPQPMKEGTEGVILGPPR